MKIRMLLFILLASGAVHCQTASEIVEKSVQQVMGETSISQTGMEIIRPNWSRKLTMKVWTKGNEFSLIEVLSPARDEGTAYLKRGKEMWNWQPSIERTIKLPPSMMSQSWMGSDFTNNDLVREASELTDYQHSIAGEDTLRGKACWKIKMTPKEDAPVVWGKVISWISKDNFIELRTEFYNEEDELINVMKASEIEKMGGRHIPTKIEMIPVKEKGHKTVITYESVSYNEPIQEGFFSIQNMKNPG